MFRYYTIISILLIWSYVIVLSLTTQVANLKSEYTALHNKVFGLKERVVLLESKKSSMKPRDFSSIIVWKSERLKYNFNEIIYGILESNVSYSVQTITDNNLIVTNCLKSFSISTPSDTK